MSKEWPDVPALLTEAREAAVRSALWDIPHLLFRLADALETMHDLYLQADSAAIGTLASSDELRAKHGGELKTAWELGRVAGCREADTHLPERNPYDG